MKKILLFGNSLGGGGQEKILSDTANTLSRFYDVKVVVMDKADVEYENKVEKIYLNIKKRSSIIGRVISIIQRYFRLRSILRKEKPNIMYSFGGVANFYNVLTCLFSKVKSIVSIHGYRGVYKSFSSKLTYKHANKIVCISKEMKKHLLELYPRLNNAIVIENGYNIDDILISSKQEAKLSEGYPHFIALGRLDEVKGFHRLIQAFSKVLKDFPTAKLSFIGQGQLLEKLKELSESLGIAESVNFLGFYTNPFAYLSKADVFVLSSYNEGFPNALVESLACGLACISVDCLSGPKEILAEEYENCEVKGVVFEKYGILVERSQDDNVVVENLAKAMLFLANNKEKLNYYKQNSLTRARDFDLDNYKNKLVNIIEQI